MLSGPLRRILMAWDKILLAALAGAAALFIWNAVVWMVIQWHNKDFKRFPQAGPVEEGLSKSGATGGMYMIPHCDDYPLKYKDPALAARIAKGPNATVIVYPPGPCMGGMTFVRGFALCFIEALGAAILFRLTWGRVESIPRAMGFGAGLGALIHGIPMLNQSNWAMFPWSHSIKSMIDGMVAMALACLTFHFIL